MEGPRLEVELELQLLAYTTATATSDVSSICDLCHNLQPKFPNDPQAWKHQNTTPVPLKKKKKKKKKGMDLLDHTVDQFLVF